MASGKRIWISTRGGCDVADQKTHSPPSQTHGTNTKRKGGEGKPLLCLMSIKLSRTYYQASEFLCHAPSSSSSIHPCTGLPDARRPATLHRLKNIPFPIPVFKRICAVFKVFICGITQDTTARFRPSFVGPPWMASRGGPAWDHRRDARSSLRVTGTWSLRHRCGWQLPSRVEL